MNACAVITSGQTFLRDSRQWRRGHQRKGRIVTDNFNMARPLEHDLPGYDRALATLHISPELRAAIRQAIIGSHDFRDPARELPKLITPLLSGQPWRWPLFDEWQARFDEAGEYPQIWPEGEDEDGEPMAASQDDVIDLFCHYLQHCAYSHAKWLRIQAAKALRPYLRLSLIPEPASVAAIERELWAAADLGADHPLMPLYPGCRASTMQLSARDLERYGYTVGGEVRQLP